MTLPGTLLILRGTRGWEVISGREHSDNVHGSHRDVSLSWLRYGWHTSTSVLRTPYPNLSRIAPCIGSVRSLAHSAVRPAFTGGDAYVARVYSCPLRLPARVFRLMGPGDSLGRPFVTTGDQHEIREWVVKPQA